MKKAKKTIVKTYKLQMKFNNEVHECDTNDLKEAILSFAPEFLKTRLYFRIEKDGKVCERQFIVFKGRMLLKNNLRMNIFLNKLIFKNV